jgi:hypothetical protein
MMTDHESSIKDSTSPEEFNKLLAISRALTSPHFHPSKRRPVDFPTDPKVALVAGHLAGRGITIQNPTIAFTCSSFLFTDTKDVAQRGATNAQRFGRACGMLKEIFTDPTKPAPILIATPNIMKDALANEEALTAAAAQHPNGTLIALKDFVTTKDWQKVQRQTKQRLKTLDTTPRAPKPPPQPKIQEEPKKPKPIIKTPTITTLTNETASQRIITLLQNAPDHTMCLSWSNLQVVDTALCTFLKKSHNRLLHDMMVSGLIISTKKSHWKLLQI